MLHTETKTNHSGQRDMVIVNSDKFPFKHIDKQTRLLGFIELVYFGQNQGKYLVSLTKVNGLQYGRMPRRVVVNSIKNGLKFLIKVDRKSRLKE